jgi:predicted 2-oxoglutarate/Fe(II)-dependent dioxygenase YbiX
MEIIDHLGDRIRCIPHAFTATECAGFLEIAGRTGFHEAPITTHDGFVMAPDIRNNTRVIHDDQGLAAALWGRLAPAVPERIDAWSAVGLNERFRFYRYEPGQFFAWHRDGAFLRNEREQSLVTLMIYLDEGFEGGSTDFDVPQREAPIRVVPQRGTVLLFRHGLRHQGASVVRGVKHVLRTDVMYRRDAP